MAFPTLTLMNINVNRQFILLDFDLIDDPRFLEFVSAAEFGTYLILRRYIWRGGEDKPHFLNLHLLYEKDKLLVCSISNEKIASLLHLNDLTRVSKQLTKLEKLRCTPSSRPKLVSHKLSYAPGIPPVM
jgi:hypothetical protein